MICRRTPPTTSSIPRALVEEGARIGPRTRVWAFAHVQANTDIGADCNVCNYVFVESGARLGDRVTVKNGVQVWQGVTAEDDVFLGPNCVLTNDPRPRSRQDFGLRTTVIQEGATIGAAAVILCDFSIGRFAFVGGRVAGDQRGSVLRDGVGPAGPLPVLDQSRSGTIGLHRLAKRSDLSKERSGLSAGRRCCGRAGRFAAFVGLRKRP